MHSSETCKAPCSSLQYALTVPLSPREGGLHVLLTASARREDPITDDGRSYGLWVLPSFPFSTTVIES